MHSPWLLRAALGAFLLAAPLSGQAQPGGAGPATIPVPHLQPAQVFEAMTGASGVPLGGFTLVLAHRGIHSEPGCPENSICSIRAAYEAGADGIELDVKLSADHKTVLGHDNAVARELVDWGGAPDPTPWGPFTDFPLNDVHYRDLSSLPFLLRFPDRTDPNNPKRESLNASQMLGHRLLDQFDRPTDTVQLNVGDALRHIDDNYPMMIWLDIKNKAALTVAAAEVATVRAERPSSTTLKYIGLKLGWSTIRDTPNPATDTGVPGLLYFFVFGTGDFDAMFQWAKQNGYIGQDIPAGVEYTFKHFCKADNGCLGAEISHKYLGAPTERVYNDLVEDAPSNRWQIAAFHTVPQYEWHTWGLDYQDQAVSYGRWYPRTDGSCCFSPTDTLNSSNLFSRHQYGSPAVETSESYDLRPSYAWNEDKFTFITTDDPTRILRGLTAKSRRSIVTANRLGGTSIPSGGSSAHIGPVRDGLYRLELEYESGFPRGVVGDSGHGIGFTGQACAEDCIWYVRTRPDKTYTITNAKSGGSLFASPQDDRVTASAATDSDGFLWKLEPVATKPGTWLVRSVGDRQYVMGMNLEAGLEMHPAGEPFYFEDFTLVPLAAAVPELSQTAGPPGYAFCADANDPPLPPVGSATVRCTFKGPTSVAYGANGRWSYRDVEAGEFECAVANFGGVDNAFGVRKACFFAPRNLADRPSDAIGSQPCAEEGGACELGGAQTPIAFGEWPVPAGQERRFTYAVGTGRVPCDLSYFPTDPAPGQVKACFPGVASLQADAPDGYTLCAFEGQVCLFHGTALVAYGTGSAFTYKTLANSARCVSSTFGVDPALNHEKHCFYRFAGPYTINPFLGNCGVEHGSCNAGAGPAIVAYGIGSNWSLRSGLSGNVDCSNNFFPDPQEGAEKICRTVPSRFQYCAPQNGSCTVPRGALLAYGAVSGLDSDEPSKMIYMPTVEGGNVECSNSTFGSDPAVGRSKHCYYYPRSVIEAPPPGYTWCARESVVSPGVCRIGEGRAASVALGAYGHFIFLPRQAGDIVCRLSNFGLDPLPGVEKGCFYRLY